MSLSIILDWKLLEVFKKGDCIPFKLLDTLRDLVLGVYELLVRGSVAVSISNGVKFCFGFVRVRIVVRNYQSKIKPI